MADKSQKLQTDLIFRANDALSNIKELSEGLDKISKLKFDSISGAMKSFTAAVKEAGSAYAPQAWG